MSQKPLKDLKKESKATTEGKANVDRNAYKLCVEQQKRAGQQNPWAICNAQFNVGKSESPSMPEIGMSFRGLEKKEDVKIRTDHSSAKKAKAAQKEHMKPHHPQIKGAEVPKIKLKHPVYKSEIEPRMSWAQLQKMQSEEALLKDKKRK